jgi:hypothetical protein
VGPVVNTLPLDNPGRRKRSNWRLPDNGHWHHNKNKNTSVVGPARDDVLLLCRILSLALVWLLRRLPVTDGRYSYSKVCMFCLPVSTAERWRWDHRPMTCPSIHQNIFSLSKGLNCSLEQWQWGGISHYLQYNIQQSFILVRNFVIRNNVSYFTFTSDLSEFVRVCE